MQDLAKLANFYLFSLRNAFLFTFFLTLTFAIPPVKITAYWIILILVHVMFNITTNTYLKPNIPAQ